MQFASIFLWENAFLLLQFVLTWWHGMGGKDTETSTNEKSFLHFKLMFHSGGGGGCFSAILLLQATTHILSRSQPASPPIQN